MQPFISMSPSPLPLITDGGNGTCVHYAESRPTSRALPWIETLRGKKRKETSAGMEKNNSARRAKDL